MWHGGIWMRIDFLSTLEFKSDLNSIGSTNLSELLIPIKSGRQGFLGMEYLHANQNLH